MNRQTKIREMCETALFAALVLLCTYLFKFPGLYGYAHLGDSMIFLAVLMLGSKRGAIAGGLGAGLADLIGGYGIWVLPTMICKAAMALVMGIMIEKRAFGLNGRILWIISAVCGGITQGLGYVIFWYVLFGAPAAVSAIPGLTFQAVSGIVIAFVVTEALQKTVLRNHLIFTTDGKDA